MRTLQGRLRSCFNNICTEAADKIDDLERQLANAVVRDIHSCHEDCNMSGCVNKRLRKEIKQMQSSSRITWYRPSERMPKEEDEVLLSIRLEDSSVATDKGWRKGGQWYDATAWPVDDADVIAWMPLPECPL